MIKNRISPLRLKPQIHKYLKNSLLFSIAYLTSTTFKLKSKQNNYEQEYDLAVIGGGSGGLATAF